MDQINFFMHLSLSQCWVINRSGGVEVFSGGSLIKGHAIYRRCPEYKSCLGHCSMLFLMSFLRLFTHTLSSKERKKNKTELNPIRFFQMSPTLKSSLSRYQKGMIVLSPAEMIVFFVSQLTICSCDALVGGTEEKKTRQNLSGLTFPACTEGRGGDYFALQMTADFSVLHLGATSAAMLVDVVGSLGAPHLKRSNMCAPCLTGGCLGCIWPI